MQFTEVNPADIPQSRGRDGRVSTELVTDFLESNLGTVKVDVPADKKLESVRATIGSYIRRHTLPISVFTASGGLYLQRDEAMVAKHQADNARAAERAAAAKAKKAEAANAPAEVAVADEADNDVDDDDASSLYEDGDE